MAVSCSYCGTSMPDIAAFCPECGRPVARPEARAPENAALSPGEYFPPMNAAVPQSPPKAASTPLVGIGDRLAGALAYFSFVPALIFLLMKHYRGRGFVRFHAWQSVLFWGMAVVLLVLGLVGSTFGYLFVWFLLGVLVGLALFFAWLALTIKALQGEWFRLPGMKLAEPWLKDMQWL